MTWLRLALAHPGMGYSTRTGTDFRLAATAARPYSSAVTLMGRGRGDCNMLRVILLDRPRGEAMKRTGLRRRGRLAASALAALLVGAAPGAAQSYWTSGLPGFLQEKDPDLLSFAAGAFDMLHQNTAGEFRGEYRFSNQFWIFEPFLGL